MVTMREIDEARAELGRVREGWRGTPCTIATIDAEAEVDRLLREWWDQGCREVPSGDVYALIASQRDEARERAESSEFDAKNAREGFYACQHKMDAARRREAEVRIAMQSAIDRARGACASNLSPGNDWVDELIGLLRVTRGQRDDAEDRWQKEVARANERGQATAEAQKIARANKVRLEDSIERAERSEVECNRLATAIRDALKVLRSPSGHPDVAEEILSFAVSAHGGDGKFADYKAHYFPEGAKYATHVEVDEKIAKALEEHYKSGHPLD